MYAYLPELGIGTEIVILSKCSFHFGLLPPIYPQPRTKRTHIDESVFVRVENKTQPYPAPWV
jgi:hypothetical protein